jgi:hypothetical protein
MTAQRACSTPPRAPARGLPNGAEIFAITVSGATVTTCTRRLSHDAICHRAELAADLALARRPRPAETHPTDPS